ncbi:MAG: glycosyltransferase [Flavobacterium sp.]|nr:MAG: glycosyltransferase [Flavobacterium sp.]
MKLSIITVNLNNLQGLKDTYESVMNQSYKNFEFLIIDGDSNDGSKEFIMDHAQHFHFWQSKKDKGIYDAMNVAIKNARGEYLFFLNSGDIFYDTTVLQSLEPLMFEDIVFGDIEEVNGDDTFLLNKPDHIDFEYLLKFGLSHQSTFIKRELFIKHGLYNSDLKICADWTFFLDVICKHNASYKHIPITISSFNTDGISSLEENLYIIKNEKEQHLKKYYAPFIEYYLSTELMVARHNALKNSRLIRILSIFFKQLRF